jgi:hypothetical protein
MPEMRVTDYEGDESEGLLSEVSHEEIKGRTSEQAVLAAVEAAERWIGLNRRTRAYRTNRFLRRLDRSAAVRPAAGCISLIDGPASRRHPAAGRCFAKPSVSALTKARRCPTSEFRSRQPGK